MTSVVLLAGLILFGDALFSLGRRFDELNVKHLGKGNRFTFLIRLIRALIGVVAVLVGAIYSPILEVMGIWLVIESTGSITWYRSELEGILNNEFDDGDEVQLKIKRGILLEMFLRSLRLVIGIIFVLAG